MSLLEVAQDFSREAQRARRLEDLACSLDAVTPELGFDFYALVQHVDIRKSCNRHVVWLRTYPEAWAEVFERDGLYANDPIHLASQKTNIGFAWSDVDRLITLSAHHKRVISAAAREGIGEGYTVPAHLPGESNGTCSFAMKVGRRAPTDSFMAAQIVGAFAMEAGRRLARKARGDLGAGVPKLTGRQLDCVVLIARGKTDWEIAQILGIKETTVLDYVRLACERYGVRRRVQLVIRAIHDGQITLHDAIG